jgi:hypothetical protein
VWRFLDPLLRLDAAWHVWLNEGTTYQLAAWTYAGHVRECPRIELYRPPVHRFGSPLKVVSCRGLFVFAPRPGETGEWVVRISTKQHVAPSFRYHIQVAAASPDDTAPGAWLVNGALVHGTLAATGVDRLDLYRFSVRSLSELFAEAKLPVSAQADLVLMRDDGTVLRCACQSSGTQSMGMTIRPGRYFLAVRARGSNTFAYTVHRLARARTVTHTAVTGSPALPGNAVSLTTTTVPPPRGGSVRVTIERFDPFAGWLYSRVVRAPVGAGGRTTIPLSTPAEGHYRAYSYYEGDLSSAPSRGDPVAYAVQAPLDP